MKTAPGTLRNAGQQDAVRIRKMVHAAHINPFSLDWRRFLLAVDEAGAVVGCIQVKPHGDGTREMASLVVVPEYRGQGFARVMIQAVQAGHPRPLYLTCRSPLQRLYRRFGFRSLELNEMPPYFRRLRRIVDILSVITRREEYMAVMLWD